MRLKVAIAGAILGFLLAILGGLFAGIPFGVILLRSFLGIIIGAILFTGLFFVIEKFLPELIKPSDSEPEIPDGPRIDIVLPEEPLTVDSGDQATQLRAMSNRNFGEEENSDEMIEEVKTHADSLKSDFSGSDEFNEAGFYAGIEQLPDIGGFTENFSQSDGESSSSSSEESAIIESISRPSSKKGSQGPGGLDPKLIAQAIRTSLKKE